jgi:hypothetical protein
MKFILTFIIGILALSSYAQSDDETVQFTRIGELTDEQVNNSGASRLAFLTDNLKAKEMAELDIKNGTPFLLLKGGIAPTIIATDPEFEKQYGIYFYEFGCSGPENEIIVSYNQTIFEHLNKEFGKKWEKEVRDDVIGFKDWR